MKDYYQVMGLNKGATIAEVRSRWKYLARKYHPDHNPDDPLAEAHFKEVLEAYRVLSDSIRRRRYDQGEAGRIVVETPPVHHYFFARCRPKTVNCFEEIELIFTYSGRGTLFRKPEMPDFFITGSPFVSHRMVIHEGRDIRETELTYIICPTRTGELQIGKANITTDHKILESAHLIVNVLPNRCAYTRNNSADGKPFHLTMHYEYLPGEEPFRMSETKKNHALLVPRSRTAFYFHQIGSGIKLVGSIWGMVRLNQEFGLHPFLGILAGNFLAGINCYILYYFAQVKPKFSSYRHYLLAQEYRERGYYLGESLGFPFQSGNFWYYLGRLLR